MKRLLLLLFVIICSCKSEKKIEIQSWNDLTQKTVDLEIENFEDDLLKLDGKGYGHGLMLKRETARQSLDSLVNLLFSDEVEIIESFSEGITLFYSMNIKADEKEFLYKHFGDEISLAEWKSADLENIAKNICSKANYETHISIDKISSYTKITFKRGITDIVKTCIKYEVGYSPN